MSMFLYNRKNQSCPHIPCHPLVHPTTQALLGAMEQQEVTIAKAGLVASLPARAGVLAAANPAGGHYHRGRTVGENLKMSSALLSRFDLIFIMVDKPDEALDAQLSEHVMALHSGGCGGQGEHLFEYQNTSKTPIHTQGCNRDCRHPTGGFWRAATRCHACNTQTHQGVHHHHDHHSYSAYG